MLTTGQGEDYTTGFWLEYEYGKNHYRLIWVDLSRWKELDVDPKVIQQIEFIGKWKNADGKNANRTQSMFVLTILKKIKEMRVKCTQERITVL